MRARLKGIDSEDAPGLGELDGYTPEDPESFALNLNITVGKRDAPGGDVFSMTVCTPLWLARQIDSGDLPGIAPGRHYLFVKSYDIDRIEAFIRDYVETAEFETWDEFGAYVGRLANWEFEDYDDTRG
jgi:hypothetical protein